MFREAILFGLLAAVRSTTVDQIIGDWTMVAQYPKTETPPQCITYVTANSGECACDDGKPTNLMNVKYAKSDDQNVIAALPIILDSTQEDVTSLLNVPCKCGDRPTEGRAVVRLVNENYFIFYHVEDKGTREHPSSVLVYAKEIKPAAQLQSDLKAIDGLKNKELTKICTKEILETYGNELYKS